jgi:hypothetical protein
MNFFTYVRLSTFDFISLRVGILRLIRCLPHCVVFIIVVSLEMTYPSVGRNMSLLRHVNSVVLIYLCFD